MRKPYYLLLLATLFTTPLVVSQAFAHGNTEPQHGGLVKIVGEYSFEMKHSANDVNVWVFYDGEPLEASELGLNLKIKGKDRKELIAIPAAKDNLFKGEVSLHSGESVLAMLTLQDGVSKIVAKYKL